MAQTQLVTVDVEFRNNIKKFFKARDQEIILDGPAGTGKTYGILQRQHLVLSKYPKARGLMLRKFRSSMNETCIETFKNDVIRDRDGELLPDAPLWRERDQKYVYGNGSEFIVAGMDDPSKVMSSKYDFFYWNETIEAKRDEWEMVMSRLRNGRVPYQQAIGDTNPGPPTHWIKQMANAGKLKLLTTTHKDNPAYYNAKTGKWTPKGDAYVNGILRDGLTGLRYKRLYEGKWVLAEGQVYDCFDPDIHVIPSSWTPPRHFPHYWCIDFGYIDPFVWQDWVEDPDTGELTLYRELYHTEIRVADACQIIKSLPHSCPPMAIICDHDAENRATVEKELGMLTLNAYKSIHSGIEAVKKRMSPSGPNKRPGVYIRENCGVKVDPKLVERHKPLGILDEFDCYVWDTSKISLDRYKDMPVDRDNHSMDTLRYMIAFIDSIATDPQEWETKVNYRDQVEDEILDHYRDTMISMF